MKRKAAKKKAAKKRAGKKKVGKAARRKPPKRPKRKPRKKRRPRRKRPVKPPKPPKLLAKVITITGGIPDDEHAHGRRFRWHSNDVAYTLTFNRRPSTDPSPWPFTQAPDQIPNKILVPAGGDSRTFAVRSTAVSLRGYGYDVNPGAVPPRPGPEVVPDP